MVKILKLSVLVVVAGVFSAQVQGSNLSQDLEILEEGHPQGSGISQALVIYEPQEIEQHFAGRLFDGTVLAGQMVLDYSYVRGALSWSLNYCGLRTLEEAVSLTAFGVTTLVAGPVAGNSAYLAFKGAIGTARWIVPAFDIWFSGFFAPVTSLAIVGPAINYGPAGVKGAVKTTYGSLTYFYSWFRG